MAQISEKYLQSLYDEIERLQSDLEEARKLYSTSFKINERLRAVLEQIANLRPGYRFPDARDIAIEALKHE
jgi:predicted RNase H-like nuclease (RuvC/YqgF family)